MTDPVFQDQTFAAVDFENMGHTQILPADVTNAYPAQPRWLRLWWNIVRIWEACQALFTDTDAAKTTAVSAAIAAEGFAANAEAAAEAAETFNPSNYVAKAGDTMAGPLVVPAGATGSQAIRASEVIAAIQAALDGLVDAAPGTLDTLNELAAALGDDPNFAATMTTALAGKQNLNANLTALAALTLAANKLVYADGAGSFAMSDLTAFARTLLDDANAGAARGTLGASGLTQTGTFSFTIENPKAQDYTLIQKIGNGITITETTTRLVGGTATVTPKINTTALGGSAHSASTTENSIARSSANVMAVGDDLVVTVASPSSADRLTISGVFTYTLAG